MRRSERSGRWHQRASYVLKTAAVLFLLMLAATAYQVVVTGIGAPRGEPNTDERAAAVLHWDYQVNQDVAACAAPKIRAELGDGPFKPGSRQALSVPPKDRFSQIVFGCGRPGEVGDKVWTLDIVLGALVVGTIVTLGVRSQPGVRRPSHPWNDVSGHRYSRPGPGGMEPGVIRGPLSGWR